MKNVLTIAGSDSCGGAGIQADIKTFSALGTYGMSVITAVTAQNTLGVMSVRELDECIIREQIDCLFDDIIIHGVKVGMVYSIEIIDTIAECLRRRDIPNVVIDPVMISKSGCHLLKPESRQELIKQLFPLATVVTPNLYEAEVIIGEKIETIDQMEKAARLIHEMGAANVVVKGGHLPGDAVDILFDGTSMVHFVEARMETKNTHGTGCTFSSAITAYLAKGKSIREAVGLAKEYISGAIANSIQLGHGVGPTNHFYDLYRKAGLVDE